MVSALEGDGARPSERYLVTDAAEHSGRFSPDRLSVVVTRPALLEGG